MRTVRTFVVVPSLPERLGDLRRIAYNLWWCWDHDAIDLFRRLDRKLWDECGHNPVKMLGQLTQAQLDEAALKVADVFRFSPALNRDRRVAVWIELPITFQVQQAP